MSNLDMGRTIEWYTRSGVTVPQQPTLPGNNLEYPIEGKEYVLLSRRHLGGLFNLFPRNARDRSILRKIVGKPVTWFSKDSIPGKPAITTHEDEALSPTSLVPSYIDYTEWQRTEKPSGDIHLYELPQSIPLNVRTIIAAQGFVHEVGHSVVQPALWAPEGHNLRFPDGRVVNGLEAMLEFASLAEQHPSISHYASGFRGKNNKFESDDPNYKPKTAISEEFCETVAAHLLGFAYCGDDARGKNPFADRPEIKTFIETFLNAQLLK